MQSVFDGKLDGVPICKLLHFDFTCADCRAEQLKGNFDIMCEHMFDLRPERQNIKNIRRAKVAFPVTKAFEKEIQGSAAIPLQNLINEEKLKETFEAPHVETKRVINYVYITLDPNGWTKKKEEDVTSDYAFVATYYDGPNIVVIFYNYKSVFLFIYVFFVNIHRNQQRRGGRPRQRAVGLEDGLRACHEY